LFGEVLWVNRFDVEDILIEDLDQDNKRMKMCYYPKHEWLDYLLDQEE